MEHVTHFGRRNACNASGAPCAPRYAGDACGIPEAPSEGAAGGGGAAALGCPAASGRPRAPPEAAVQPP